MTKRIRLAAIVVTCLSFADLGQTQVKSFEILNPSVEQGGVVVIRVNPQWQGPTVCISAFKGQYVPNKYGYAFIGVPLNIQRGNYRASLVECGRGLLIVRDLGEFKVSVGKFPKTRTGGMSGKSSRPRKISELRAIESAFSKTNQSQSDFTNGLKYSDPLSRRDVIDPYGRIYLNSRLGHLGIDFRVPVGTSVGSVNRGEVVLVAEDYSKEGNMIIINHGLGIFSVYMHLSKINVKEKEVVERGQIIGLSGETGAGVREPHLHLNIKTYKDYIDPPKFIDTVNQYLQ